MGKTGGYKIFIEDVQAMETFGGPNRTPGCKFTYVDFGKYYKGVDWIQLSTGRIQ